jgi:hypothetical protein
MKTIIIAFLLFCSICYGQKKKDTSTLALYKYEKGNYIITKNSVTGSIVNVQFDSVKYYFSKYIKLKNKGIPDSLNKFYKKLNSIKK